MKLKNHIDWIKNKSDHRPRFPLPLPPTTTKTNTSIATSAASISSSDLEKLQVLGHAMVAWSTKSVINAPTLFMRSNSSTMTPTPLSAAKSSKKWKSSAAPTFHIVRCHGIFEKPSGDIAILMEYMNLGTLDLLLRTY